MFAYDAHSSFINPSKNVEYEKCKLRFRKIEKHCENSKLGVDVRLVLNKRTN